MNTETPITFKYQTGGSLSATDPTYVQRQADQDLYNLLQQGEFCYVLNSRQMGKSSLRVRTMQRLQQDGYACAEVDLSGIGSQLSEEKWYNGLVHRLMRSFTIPSEVNWRSWWKEHHDLSPVQRLGELFEEILLPSVPQNIVIFLDEIDSVLSFDFPTDDFFALIRYYYNQRVNNPNYNRLRFCLLGVATPSELIQDKQRTPFNIGRGVELTGLTEAEAIPVLSQGLASVVEHPEELLTEVLYWTGGQPFLTQKLCRLIVENSASILLHGNIAEGFARFVRSQIIENWESKDQPEHLKTIRDRVIRRSEQRASYLLELYQKIWQGEVTAKSTPEESELQLSGLVVNRQGKLRVYNPIYREVFNDKWIEAELAGLRPYAEAFRGWIASGDKSHLLRGKVLEEAEKWAEGKELSYQDRQFLAASRQQKIQEETEELERQAQLERERKDREAAEQANKKLAEANHKAKRRSMIGIVVLITFSVTSVLILGSVSTKSIEIWREAKTLEELSNLGRQLLTKNLRDEAKQTWKYAGFSNEIKNHQLRRAFQLSSISWANQKLFEAKNSSKTDQREYLEKAEKTLKESLNLLERQWSLGFSPEQQQIQAYTLGIQCNLLALQGDHQNTLSVCNQAFDLILHFLNRNFTSVNLDLNVLFRDFAESIYSNLIGVLLKTENPSQENLRKARYLFELYQVSKFNNFSLRRSDLETNLEQVDQKINQLAPKTAVIYPIVGLNDQLHLMMKLPQQEKLYYHKINGSYESLLEATSRLEREIFPQTWRSGSAHLSYSQKIYDWLIQSIEKDLSESEVQTLLFVLDSSFLSIPLAALHNGKNYLVEKYSIGVTPSLFVTDTNSVNLKNSSVLAMGATTFPVNPELPDIPAVKVELSGIMRLWPGQVFLNEEFTLENLKYQLQQNSSKIIHLATQSEIRSGTLNSSYIQLWDRKLRINQMGQLNWNKLPVELLVLSGCQSILGDSEFMFGYSGEAIKAGVNSVIGTLWYINDAATALLMVEFYNQLRTAPTKAEALRQAQVAMLQGQVRIEDDKLITSTGKISPLVELQNVSSIDTYSHPYFWAGVVLMGNPW